MSDEAYSSMIDEANRLLTENDTLRQTVQALEDKHDQTFNAYTEQRDIAWKAQNEAGELVVKCAALQAEVTRLTTRLAEVERDKAMLTMSLNATELVRDALQRETQALNENLANKVAALTTLSGALVAKDSEIQRLRGALETIKKLILGRALQALS